MRLYFIITLLLGFIISSNGQKTFVEIEKNIHGFNVYKNSNPKRLVNIASINNAKLPAVEKKSTYFLKLNKNTIQLLFISVILFFLGIFGALFFYKFKLKAQQLIASKEQEIHNQNSIRHENEQELKRINGIIEGQDIERNRIAKEIHDGIGGKLAGIKLNLSQTNTSLQNTNLTDIENQLGGLFCELRNISHNLNSNYIKDKNFTTVLNDLKKEYELRKEFEIEIVIFPENAFENSAETIKHQLYRIIQELLANISKHAKATRVSILITKYEKHHNLIIEDNGIGFDQKSKNGIGITNIKERVEILNGTITLETKPNQGSTFIIDIPI